ncbi:MAG: SDR family NAD(P)-dependent oxidoreductase, partial [Opitutaceae bacterium]|nr:SDR family NAD(P)-dependent oxidoreductase [Opitutaceae bacterium]
MSTYLNELFGLTGKVAVVIGGTGELCGAMAAGLAGAGAEVVIVGRNAEKAAARIAQISAAGGRAWFHAAEATSKAEVEGLLAAVLARSG